MPAHCNKARRRRRTRALPWSRVELAEKADFQSGQKAAEGCALYEAGNHMRYRHTSGIVRTSYWVTTGLRHKQLILSGIMGG